MHWKVVLVCVCVCVGGGGGDSRAVRGGEVVQAGHAHRPV